MKKFTTDIRLNNVRAGAEGPAAQQMALLQFASTLQDMTAQETTVQEAAAGDDGAEGAAPRAAPGAKPFDAVAAFNAMSGAGGSQAGPARLAYRGEDGAEEWAPEQKDRKKEKKRKKKAKKEKRKAKKLAKVSELVNEKGMTFEQATNAIDFFDSSDSDSSLS